ncbi:Indole-3-acetate O-methyltransferase 1 [Capsicum baccatum]|uniref:Indole-3-acetate O-methyltransferase 1 n=1 Tax=Capsicum baccatum TaxID=33114 RepID=A0A2G2X5I6_CAPBA|nr:Indole-3-acetate O-methyltransferase 1 [Capsicum baccatum]
MLHLLKETLDGVQLSPFVMVYLGCSCGSNTVYIIDVIVEHMRRRYEAMVQQPPEFFVFFSDLPSNHFNTLFEILPPLANNGYGSMEEFLASNSHRSYFAAGVPVSFYRRLFPARSVDDFYSFLGTYSMESKVTTSQPLGNDVIGALMDLIDALGRKMEDNPNALRSEMTSLKGVFSGSLDIEVYVYSIVSSYDVFSEPYAYKVSSLLEHEKGVIKNFQVSVDVSNDGLDIEHGLLNMCNKSHYITLVHSDLVFVLVVDNVLNDCELGNLVKGMVHLDLNLYHLIPFDPGILLRYKGYSCWSCSRILDIEAIHVLVTCVEVYRKLLHLCSRGKIVEVCLATRPHNGGLISLDDLCKLLGQRRKAVRETISEDDCLCAISKLVLGSGFEVITVGKKQLVRSVPTELNKDHNKILELDQVPDVVLDNRSMAYNKGRIYIYGANESTAKAYKKQFQSDLADFLCARSKEMKRGGSMFLVLLGRTSVEPTDQGGSGLLFGTHFQDAWDDLVQEKLHDILGIKRIESGYGAEFLDYFPRITYAPKGEKRAYADKTGRCNMKYNVSGQPPSRFSYERNRDIAAPCTTSRYVQASESPHSHQIHKPEAGGKLRLLCSYGDGILPRPNEGKLRYVAGEMRIISIRKNLTFDEIVRKTTAICNQPHTIKYQLPEEDLDALVSILFYEDLQYMIKEHHDLGKSSQRIGLFLIPSVDSEGPCFFEVVTLQLT